MNEENKYYTENYMGDMRWSHKTLNEAREFAKKKIIEKINACLEFPCRAYPEQIIILNRNAELVEIVKIPFKMANKEETR